MNQTLVIAEAGVNHNGDLDLAFRLAEAAANAGADVVKFQTFCSQSLVTNFAEKADYQKLNTGSQETQLSMLKKLELDIDQHVKLIDHCKALEIEFLSTAFDLSSIDLLASLRCMNRWKIPSGEITNLPYLEKIGSFGLPVILSTGMSNLGDIESAINVLQASGLDRNLITILHCTTEYPAPLEEVNLNALKTIANAFQLNVGYSDHTEGIVVPIAAVSLGAKIIEKHITLDNSMLGPDHKASLEPLAFSAMVDGIRSIELAMGSFIKSPTISEKKNMLLARKSIVASQTILKGDIFSSCNLTCKRPGNGLSPMMIPHLLGKVASKTYQLDDLIDL